MMLGRSGSRGVASGLNGLAGVGAAGGRTFPISGWYYTGEMYGQDTAQSPTQDVEYAIRFEVGVQASFDRIGIDVTTLAAEAVMRLGIRNDLLGAPGTLLLDAGTIDASSTGHKEITIAVTLAPARYWLTCTMQAATGAAVRSRSVDPYIGQASSAASNGASYQATGRSGALPASYGTPSGISGGPKIMLRVV